MSRTQKKLDAVAMMRSARDRISAEIEGMTLEEELNWLASQKIDDPFLKRLRDRAAQNDDAADRPSAGPPRRRSPGDRWH
jgi:FtsZ-interacting cell division protein ZipA